MVLPIRTVLVSNIPLASTEDDVKTHFTSVLTDCQPIVGTLVPYTKLSEEEDRKTRKEEKLSAIVTFRGDNSWSDILVSKPFNPKADGDSEVLLAFEEQFLGLSPIEQDTLLPTPHFHFIFIHGLGGHAFKTWTNHRYNTPGDLCMWPRDLLARALHKRRRYGRYWTFGYNANTRDRDPHVIKTIEDAAEELLAALRQSGFAEDPRPIYFACHSLGGLVLCNALNSALRASDNKASLKPQYRSLFMHNGECKIKGIVFFGTPFQGSSLANIAIRFKDIARYFEYNVQLVQSLKDHSKDLANITSRFNQVQHQYKIEPLIYHESRRMCNGMWRLVVNAESARGAFTHTARALNADHIQMIKYANDQDKNFQMVRDDIFKLLDDTLPETPVTLSRPVTMNIGSLESRKTVDFLSGTDEEVDILALEAFANRLLKIVAQQKRDRNMVDDGSQRKLSSNWFKKSNLSTTDHGSTHPQSPVNQARESKKPKLTYGELRGMLDDNGQLKDSPEGEGSKQANSLIVPLRDYHTVFILDDSASMREPISTDAGETKSRWDVLVEALQYFGDIAAQSDDDGITISFLHNRMKDAYNVRSGQQALDILASIDITRSQPAQLDVALWDVFKEYLETYHQYHMIKRLKLPIIRVQVQPPKPLNVIVITDGVSHDYEKVERALIRAARALPDLGIPQFSLGVQFLQIGNDSGATKRLRLLDDKLLPRYGVRDICDTRELDTRGFEGLQKEDLVKKLREILLGSVDDDYQGFAKTEYKGYWDQFVRH